MHVITLGEPLHTRLQKSRFFFYSNNYWQAHSLVTTFNLVSECQKKQNTPISSHMITDTHSTKTLPPQWGCTSQTDIYLQLPKHKRKKRGARLCANADHLPFIIPSESTTQRSAAVFTMWFHKKKKKDNVQAALNLKEHHTASTLVLYDSVVDAFYKGV